MSEQKVLGERGAFTETASASYSLPSRYYQDPEIHRAELKVIFHKSWAYVGHVTDLPEPGAYFVDYLVGQPLLVVKDKVGTIRAFYNVCQHRGHELLCGRGTLRGAITCPYHGWVYGLDGKLLAARMTDGVPGFDKADFPLREVRLAETAGLLFVNLDSDAPAFDSEAEGFGATILKHHPDMAGYIARWRFTFEVAANWKVVVDNFSEGYHIPIAHPELAKLYNQRGEPGTLGKRFAFYHNSAREGFKGFPTTPGESYLSWTFWPNLCMLSLPGCRNLIVIRMAPDGPLRCRERVEIYTPPGEPEANAENLKVLFADTFNKEDIAIVESVQRGLESLGFDQSRYVADEAESWFSESALHRFHKQILDALNGA